MADEVGGWVLDPKNPNRATYTDEDGFEHEQFAPGYNPSSATTPTPATATAAPQTSPEAPRGGWRRLADSFNDATQHGFPGLVARKWYDWTDYGVQDLIKKGYSPEEAEAVADKLIGVAQKGLREDAARKQAADPNWKPDESFFKAAGEIDKWGPWLAGQVLGSAGPESFVNPGGSAGARIAAQGAMGAASDAAYQTADLVDKVAEEFSAVQMLTSAAAGAGLQSAFEVPGFIRSLFKERGVDTTPGADPRANLESEPGIVGETSQAETLDPKDYSPEELAKIESTGMWAQGEDGLLHSTGEQLPTEPELPLGAPAEPAQRTKADLAREAGLIEGEAPTVLPEAAPDPKALKRVEEVRAQVDELTKDWTNAPEFEIVHSASEVADPAMRQALEDNPNAIAAYGEDGKVRILASEARNPEIVKAAVFHESLGHHGLTQKFEARLDDVLEDLYNNSKGSFKSDVDAWMKRNPDAYDGSVARAADEVLAEMSEAGRISPNVLSKIRNQIKEFGREMGLDLKYSDGEIRTILGMAHSAVTDGTGKTTGGVIRLKDRRQEMHDASDQLDKTEKGKTQSIRPYEAEPDYYRFVHRAENGEKVSGNYRIDPDGNIDGFSVGMGSYANRVGPKIIRSILKDIRAQHPEARSLSGYRITGSRRAAGQKADEVTIRFMRRASRDDDEMTLIGAINPMRITSKYDIEEILEGLAAEAPETIHRPFSEVEAEAKAMGLSPAKVSKGAGDIGDITTRVFAARQAMTAQLNKVAKLQDKLVTDGYSEAIQADFIKAMTTLQAIHATVSNNASELGRALGSLRMFSDGKMNASKIVKFMQEQGNELLGNPEQFQKFMQTLAATQNIQGTLPAIKMARQSFKKNAEKYIFSAWYNMLLSSPATHTANFVGTGGNFLADLTFAAGAAVKGQFGRNADRIRGREIAYRVWGALSALKASSDTWSNTRRVLNGIDSAGAKAEDSQHVLGGNKVLDFASGALEGPSRALAGADEFWKNVLQLSNIHGLAVRNAGNQGLKGKAFWDKVSDLITNPTDEMLEASADYAKVLQFQDKASAIGKALIDLQTPKANSTVPGRVARGVLKVAVPFVRTPDALIRTALRYTPLGAFERENIKGWKADGAERDKVKARLIMGSAISFWLATQAYKGNITGQGPSDPKKKQEWLASHQENSIKVGDKYYSINGLEPVSTVINGIATLTERSKSGEIGEGDLAKQALSLTQGIGAVLTENSYMEGLNSLLDINDKDTKQAETAFTNFIAGLASSATTPAILRKYTQAVDPAVRDTTGDGSMYDRITGRIKSALPGLSEELPQRYDVYGRAQERKVAGPDLASRTNVRLEETDPVVKELVRLANLTDKVLVGAPGRNVKVDGVQRRLTAEEFQKYQHLSGYLIVEATKAQMTTPEWQTSDDAYKIEAMGDITKQMRQAARNYLFDPEDEETEDDTKEEED